MQVVLNIGLDKVQGRTNAYGTRLSRAEVALEQVRALNFKVTAFKLLQSDTEPTLVVGAIHHGDVNACVNWLAEQLNQDCIAVYIPPKNEGHLYGPRASEWGDFNPEFFFMIDGSRLSDGLKVA